MRVARKEGLLNLTNISEIPSKPSGHSLRPSGPGWSELSPEHYLLIILHRKWLVLGIFFFVSVGTALVSYWLPDLYTSETLILVDPQQVPDSYVRATVTGDIRNRLGALSQQILSTTRLQRIIDAFNLYPEERRKLPREDVINRMRADVAVKVMSDFAGREDLQAFKITYSGKDPRIVAQVTNELASLFIEENLKVRERMATGTSEFLENQLKEARKKLEVQEAQIRDFKLKHIGEMPEQQQANLQILGQLQARLQAVTDSLNRAEQQKSYLQAVGGAQNSRTQEKKPEVAIRPDPAIEELRLAELLSRYGEKHPDVVRLKRQIQEERQAREQAERQGDEVGSAGMQTPLVPATNEGTSPLEAQLVALGGEIAKHAEDQERLLKSISDYQAKIESIPVREQQIANLIRDYEISREHYQQLLAKKLSAETATQLEIRQKGEKFTILDPAQIAEKPSRPNRLLINAMGSAGGLALGLVVALVTELLGISITSPGQVTMITGLSVLAVIPIIRTREDRVRRRRWGLASAASGLVTMLVLGAFLLYRYRSWFF